MLKSLGAFALVVVLVTQASEGGTATAPHRSATAVQPSAPPAQAPRLQPNCGCSRRPSPATFNDSVVYGGGGRFVRGLRPADSKVLGNYPPYPGAFILRR